MSAATRIYLVSDEDTATKRLVRASTQAQATHHAARSRFDVKVASQDDLVNLIASGVKVEEAGAQPAEPTQPGETTEGGEA